MPYAAINLALPAKKPELKTFTGTHMYQVRFSVQVDVHARLLHINGSPT
jgi:hypothetical protein